MHSLPLFHRLAGQPVIVVGEGEAAAAKRRLVERAGGVVVGVDHAQARFAFVALGDPDAVSASLKARGVLVNVADRPDLCDFTLPSVLDRDPVLIAVSTGGASAGLAKAVRLRLDAVLPASLGRLAVALQQARSALRARWPDAIERRRAIDTALDRGGQLDPLVDQAEDAVDAWLACPDVPPPQCVTIDLVSDDPDDLTLRQARWLGTADRIACAGPVPEAILARGRADAARIALEAVDPQAPGVTLILRRG